MHRGLFVVALPMFIALAGCGPEPQVFDLCESDDDCPSGLSCVPQGSGHTFCSLHCTTASTCSTVPYERSALACVVRYEGAEGVCAPTCPEVGARPNNGCSTLGLASYSGGEPDCYCFP